MSFELLRGVLGRDFDGPIGVNSPAVNFSDFDLFTLQRRRADALAFLNWKVTAEKKALARLPVAGDILGVAVNQFAKKEPLLQFTLPLDKPQAETLELLMNSPRPRQSGIDEFLQLQLSQGTLQFRIDKIVRSGAEKFSQVFFGSLLCTAGGGISATCEVPICLKLFDEVLFPIRVRVEDLDSNPSNCFRSLNFASDMMRREYAAYQRLQYLQGTLLPHNYGFHEFTLPDGRAVWGFFLECIDGCPLSSFPLHTWPESVQRTTVSKLRHSVRALLYGGIQQADWHLDQVLVIESPGSEGGGHNTDFVLIDFAFIRLRFGEARCGAFPELIFYIMSLYKFLSSGVPIFDRPPANVSPPAERKGGTTMKWAGDSGLNNVFLKTSKEVFPNFEIAAFQDLIQRDTTVHDHLVDFENNDLYQKLPVVTPSGEGDIS
ncbi:hypothetical protein MPER_11226 [Moniliophthora perniciosa FA553]|nr:hypothetical protein MPER_11226 [Moniliophthora perniciosa FA553]